MTDTSAVTPALVLDGDALDPIGGGGALVGYARVSTTGQLLDRQLLALREAGCQRVFSDKKSGKNIEREELHKCLDYLRPGDTLVVPALDRLGRSLQDLISIVAGLRKRGIGFRSMHEALDTTTPGGRLVFHVFAALAEFIRELIVDGTHEGLAAARARGQRLGRPPAMTGEQIRQARALLTRPDESVSSIARLLGVSRSTIYKYVPEIGTGRGQLGAGEDPPLSEVGEYDDLRPSRPVRSSDEKSHVQRERVAQAVSNQLAALITQAQGPLQLRPRQRHESAVLAHALITHSRA